MAVDLLVDVHVVLASDPNLTSSPSTTDDGSGARTKGERERERGGGARLSTDEG